MTGVSNDYIRWGGLAGQTIYIKQSDGSWAGVGAPEHAESASYVQRAVDDGGLLGFLKFAFDNPASLNTEQRAFMANPLLGLDSYGQGYRWGGIDLFDNAYSPQQAGALLQRGYASYLAPTDIQAGQAFNFEQSPAEQSKRAGGDDWLGTLMTAAAVAAAAWFAAPYLGFGEAAAATAAGEAAAATAAAEFVPVGAMSVPGTFGAMSTTAAAQSATWLGGLEMASAAGAGFSLGTAVDALNTGKNIMQTMQIVNQATGQRSVVPANAAVPAGWAVDSRWSPQIAQSTFKYDPATGGLYMETPQGMPQSGATPQNVVPPNASALSPTSVLLLAGLGLVLYLVK